MAALISFVHALLSTAERKVLKLDLEGTILMATDNLAGDYTTKYLSAVWAIPPIFS